ncbi:MAG: FumA C-terminus/TtdB family hydratase beta subunit [Promethearchaeota archaeon]
MGEFYLITPITEDTVRKLKVGDTLYVSGTIVTARDEAHLKALEFQKEGKNPPVNFDGIGVFHCGPVMKKSETGEWTVVAAGPTTSARMEIFEDEFIKAFHPRIIIGKGGMGKRTTKACQEEACVYGAFTGGAALLAANRIIKVKDVFWLEELGMPECLWVYEVKDFGPLIVTIDSHGNNLTERVKEKIMANKEAIIREL